MEARPLFRPFFNKNSVDLNSILKCNNNKQIEIMIN